MPKKQTFKGTCVRVQILADAETAAGTEATATHEGKATWQDLISTEAMVRDLATAGASVKKTFQSPEIQRQARAAAQAGERLAVAIEATNKSLLAALQAAAQQESPDANTPETPTAGQQ